MKTLVISYLPKNEYSNTKRLLDAFIENTKNNSLEILDLTKQVPDLFMPLNLVAYIKRNYMGEPIDETEKLSLEKMDKMTEQLIEANNIILAFPMHNFSLPAPVKAYFDSVIQKGKTFDIGENGYHGLLEDKKALLLMSSGGVYEGSWKDWEHAISLSTQLLNFMGIKDVRSVTAAGLNAYPKNADNIISEAVEKVKVLARDWIT